MANPVSVDLLLSPVADKAAFQKIESEAKKSGESAGSSFDKGFSSGISNIAKAGAIAVVAAGAGIALAFKKGVSAAIEQENAVNRLNTALQITGKFTKETSQSIQDYADSLERVTTFSGDAIISTAAYIQQLANLDSQGLKRATKATTDLAAALRIDLESAGALVAKAIDGNTGALGRYGIKVDATSSKAQNLANVLTAVEGKFGGSAEAQVNTYAGAITQAGGAFGKILEEIGKFIVESPVIVSLVKSSRDAFFEVAASIAEFRKSFNLITDIINPLSEFANGIITYVVAPLELIGNIGVFAFNKIVEGVAAAVSVIGGFGAKLAEFLGKFGVDNALTQGLQTFGETSNQVFVNAANTAQQSFQSILDFPLSNGLALQNEEIRANLSARNQIIAEKNAQVVQSGEELQGVFGSIADAIFKKTEMGLTEANKNIQDFANKTGQAVRSGIGVAAGNAFAAFGKALAEGDNAIKAFTDSFIASIGQLAVQQGTAFILQGIAYSFIPQLAPLAGGLIAAGAALATFGGVLSAVGSKGKPAVGGGGIGATADTQVIASPETLTQPDEVAQRSESGPRVSVTIQGNVFDTDETGNRIIDIINANFETKGNSFNNARFA